MNNTVYTSKQKNYEFSSKIPLATKHSPLSNVYYIVIYRNFLFQYSLIGIVKPKLPEDMKYDAEFGKQKICPKMCAKCTIERLYKV